MTTLLRINPATTTLLLCVFAPLLGGCNDGGLKVIENSVLVVNIDAEPAQVPDGEEFTIGATIYDKPSGDRAPELDPSTVAWRWSYEPGDTEADIDGCSGDSLEGAAAGEVDGHAGLRIECTLTATTALTQIYARAEREEEVVEEGREIVVIPSNPPTARIDSPTTDGRYYANHLVPLEALVADPESPARDLLVSWSSTLAGSVDAGDTTPDDAGVSVGYAVLPEGEQGLTVTVTDPDGRTGTASLIVTVGPPNTPPACAINAPMPNEIAIAGSIITFEGTASDAEVDSSSLAVRWESDRDGILNESPPRGDAVGFSTNSLSEGPHLISLTVTDDAGDSCVAGIAITVDSPPEAEITSPADGGITLYGEPIVLSGLAADSFDDPTTLLAEWSSSLDGSLGSTRADSAGSLTAFSVTTLQPGIHDIHLTVTDSAGLWADDAVTIEVACPTEYFPDSDGDGYGSGTPSLPTVDCSAPEGHVADASDCDDGDAGVSPSATELCNGVDDDCDGNVDGGATDASTWYADTDADGFGDSAASLVACSPPPGFSGTSGDCDDSRGEVSPVATEACSRSETIDDDCDGQVDEGFVDTDADGTPDCRDVCPVYTNPYDTPGDGSEASPYASITEALALRGECDTIIVNPGVYEETVDLGTSDVELIGWFAYVYDASWRDRADMSADEFIAAVDCTAAPDDGVQSVIAPSYGVEAGPGLAIGGGQTERTLVRGLTLWGGGGHEVDGYTQGGGIWANDSDATILDNVIICNSVTGNGGGARLAYWEGEFSGNLVARNSATSDPNGGGGGVEVSGTSAGWIYANTIVSNDAVSSSGDGGGILIRNGTAALVESNWIEGNSASDRGGGIRSGGATLLIVGNVLVGNLGDGLFVSNDDAGVVAFNTIADNERSGLRGDITTSAWGAPTPSLVGNIIAFNGRYGLELVDEAAHATLAWNDLYGNALGEGYDAADGALDAQSRDGNIVVDPVFYDRPAGDYDLDLTSPVRDAACTAAEIDALLAPYGASYSADYAGVPRSATDPWDMGAFEY